MFERSVVRGGPRITDDPAVIAEDCNRREIGVSVRWPCVALEPRGEGSSGGSGNSSAEVVACFKDKDYMVRSESLLAAASINPTGCKNFLMSGLKDEEAEVRMASVQAWVGAPLKDLEPLFQHLD